MNYKFPIISLYNSIVKKIGSYNRTMLYLYPWLYPGVLRRECPVISNNMSYCLSDRYAVGAQMSPLNEIKKISIILYQIFQ